MKNFLLKYLYLSALPSIVCFFISSIEAQTATDVSGTINTDTKWDLKGSPYYLKGDVKLGSGVTLTIEPGVFVNGYSNLLDVSMGILSVNGNSSSMVVLRDTRIFSQSDGSGQLIISYARIIGGEITASENIFSIESSYIENLWNSIIIKRPISDCNVRQNIFIGTRTNNPSALFLISTDQKNNVFIGDNVFYHSGTIVETQYTYDSSMTYVNGNNFLIINLPTLILTPGNSPANMVADNNYWGTLDQKVIEKMIYDKNDDPKCASYIQYIPFLKEPNLDAPKVPLPEIQVQPQDQTVQIGSTASFNVQATGLGPITYKWQIYGTDIPGATNSTLTLTNVQYSQSGDYSVVISNFAGDCVASQIAHLKIEYDPPVILTQPEDQIVEAYHTACFKSEVSGTLPLYFQWQFNGANIPNATNTTLILTNVMPSQAGNYCLVVSNFAGDCVTSQVAHLTVRYDPPVFIIQPEDQRVTGYQTATFNATVVGTAPLYFQWQFNGANIPNATNTALTLTNVTISQQGFYQLVVSNFAGDCITSRLALLSVDFHFLVIYSGPQDQVVEVFQTATFTTGVDGTPPLRFQWQFNGIDIPNATNSTLILTNVQMSQTGDYRLIVTDPGGIHATSQLAHLTVQYLPPVFLTQPTNQMVAVSQTVTLRATVSGSPTLHYQWQLNGTNINYGTNNILILTNVQVAASGSYTVIVTNEGGIAISQPAILDVRSVFIKVNDVLVTESHYALQGSATITLTTGYTNGIIFYTLDGTEPTFESTFYTGPFTINRTTTIRAIAYSMDLSQCGIAPSLTVRILGYYNLVATNGGGGTVFVHPYSDGPYLEDTVVSVTATPNPGWSFIHWLGDADGTNETISVAITRNKTVKAIFGTTFSTTVTGNGSVSVEPQTILYPYGTVVRLSAIPQPGNYFGIWGNATNGNINPLYFTITAPNQTVSSLFATLPDNKVSLTVVPKGRGRVTISPQANSYAVGSVVTLNAIPEEGEKFIGWTGSVTNKQNPLVLTLNQSQIIEANFNEPMDFTLTIITNAVGSRELQITFDGVIGKVYRFDTSTDIVNWYEINTVTNLSGRIQFSDQGFMNLPYRFYKATIHQ